jgi:hypothetical protein
VDEARGLVNSVVVKSSRSRLQAEIIRQLIQSERRDDAAELDDAAADEYVSQSRAIALAHADSPEEALRVTAAIRSKSVRAVALLEIAKTISIVSTDGQP